MQHIYQINTIPYLAQLGVHQVPEIPDDVLNALRYKWNIDYVYLLSVWERTGVAHDPTLPQNGFLYGPAQDCTGKSWNKDQIIPSGFSIRSYTVPEELGGTDGLRSFRQRLHARGMKLILDFVPNHTARDHAWILSQPDYYVHEPNRAISAGKDPYSDPWIDTAQLDYSNPAVHQAMIEQIQAIQHLCDGVRCDMAHLVMGKIFDKTWEHAVRHGIAADLPPFWSLVRKTVGHDFLLIAEAYAHTEYRLIQQGFDAVYDKQDGFYDRLVDTFANPDSSPDLEGHIRGCNRVNVMTHRGQRVYSDCLVRFLENHDENRAARVFGPHLEDAARIIVEQYEEPHGYILWHNGQFTGTQWRTPVQLKNFLPEQPSIHILEIYERILRVDPHWRDHIPPALRSIESSQRVELR